MKFKFKKFRFRHKIPDINVQPGDILNIVNKKKTGQEDVLLYDRFEKPMTINEVATFDAEVDGRESVGGVLISKKK